MEFALYIVFTQTLKFITNEKNNFNNAFCKHFYIGKS